MRPDYASLEKCSAILFVSIIFRCCLRDLELTFMSSSKVRSHIIPITDPFELPPSTESLPPLPLYPADWLEQLRNEDIIRTDIDQDNVEPLIHK